MKRAAFVPALLLLAAPLGASELWVHLHADQIDGGGGRVVVNLPVRALAKALPLIPTDIEASCDVQLNGNRIRPDELRAALLQLNALPPGTELPISRENITVRREGGSLVFTSKSRWDTEDEGSLTIPFDLAATLLGREGEIDMRSAIQLLIRRGAGEIMMIDGRDHRVRVWVDSNPAAPLRRVSSGKVSIP